MTHTVIGLFDNRSEAQAAMQELMREGFIKDHIDISNRSVNETATTATTASTASTSNESVGDSVSNFFSSLFGDDPATAQNYTNAAYDADAIVTVQVDSDERARLAADILDRHGAIDVDERGSSASGTQNFAQTGGTTNTAYANDAARTEGEMAIPVIEEELRVGKREVESGGARIRSRVIERPVEEHVRLREEHVVVNRRPVNRAVTESDLANFKEGEIELTERAERAVVGKEAHVVEEVVVGKEVTEREETIRDTVRRTDVDVEEIDTNRTTSEDVTTRRANS